MTLRMREKEIWKEATEEERRKIIIKMIKQGFGDEQILLLCDTSEAEIMSCRECVSV